MPDHTNGKLSGAASIIGVGSTDYRALKEAGEATPPLELASQAIGLALQDAGLEAPDIDGLMTMNVPWDELALRLSLQDLRVTAEYASGGRWVVPALQHAAQSLAADTASAIIIVLALSRRASYADSAAPGGNAAFEAMQAMGGPGAHSALMARRYMHEFGDCTAALCEIATSNRDNAALNPAAVFRQAMTKEDYYAARMIAEPLRLFDYCMVNDGAVALILARTPQSGSGRAVTIGAVGLVRTSRATLQRARLLFPTVSGCRRENVRYGRNYTVRRRPHPDLRQLHSVRSLCPRRLRLHEARGGCKIHNGR